MSVKDQVLQAINRLPDDIDYRDVPVKSRFSLLYGRPRETLSKVALSRTSK